jgi:hypothetical protein
MRYYCGVDRKEPRRRLEQRQNAVRSAELQRPLEAYGWALHRVAGSHYLFTAGETEEEALEMLRDAMAGWFESALAHGDPIPEPEPPGATRYSGYITVRMPPSLHRHLAEQARSEGVSLNQWAVTLLARGLG